MYPCNFGRIKRLNLVKHYHLSSHTLIYLSDKLVGKAKETKSLNRLSGLKLKWYREANHLIGARQVHASKDVQR
jgi:hypothetical protein